MRLFITMLSDSVKYNFRPVIIKKEPSKNCRIRENQIEIDKVLKSHNLQKWADRQRCCLSSGDQGDKWYLLRIRPS